MKTRIRTISFYPEFSCDGAACPMNCCHGWLIPVDDDAAKRFRREKGLFGLRLKLALGRKKEQATFNRMMMRCPLLDLDRLCAIHKKRGEACLPEACRLYPREWANLGDFVERTLDISCIRAAEIFLKSDSGEELGLSWTEETGLWETPRAGDNDDPAFLEELVRQREDVMRQILDSDADTIPGLDELVYSLAGQAAVIQSRYLETTQTGLKRIRLFPFSIMLLNELMSTCFFEDHLKMTEPVLYRMCRSYYKTFDRLTEIEGQKLLDNLCERYFAPEGPGSVRSFRRLFAYELIREWYESYEDYSFVRRIVEAAIHINMVLLFELLAFQKGEKPDLKKRALILAVYEKRTHHNGDVLGQMVKRVGERLFPVDVNG